MKIIPEKMYSGVETQRLLGIKTRVRIPGYIEDGTLEAIKIGSDSGGGTRYAIKGEWILSFIERKKAGLIKGDKYTIRELKTLLQQTLDYCEKNNIKTLIELEDNLNNL